MNAAEGVSRLATEDPQRVALITPTTTWTYGELLAATAEQEAEFDRLGIRVGDHVAIVLPNSAAFVVAYLACLRRGYVPVPISPKLAADEVRWLLVDSAAVASVVAPDLAGLAPAEAKDIHVITKSPETCRPSASDATGELIRDPENVDETHPATLLYTSGTTGRPKGIVLSQRNVAFTMQAKKDHLDLRPDDVLLLYLPLQHCFGLISILSPGLHAGATVVLADGFERDQIRKFVNDHSVTWFFAVPQVFRLLLDAGVSPDSMPSVRSALSAGDTLPDDVQHRWARQMGWSIHQEYGLTEAPFVTYNNMSHRQTRSVGTAVDGVAISIRRATGEPAPAGEIGEVWVRGPNVMSGYWRSPEATTAAVVDEWLKTADLGTVDESGHLHLAARSSEVIVVSGQNVYAAEVERVLAQDDGVTDVSVYGVPHELTGEIVCASVVRGSTEVTKSDLRARCARELARFKVPVVIDFVAALPVGKTGKKDKKAMAAQARDRWSRPSAKDGTS